LILIIALLPSNLIPVVQLEANYYWDYDHYFRRVLRYCFITHRWVDRFIKQPDQWNDDRDLDGNLLVFIAVKWTGTFYEPMALVVGAMICIAAANAAVLRRIEKQVT
jgi:hypothetical protein